jgi:hypothetical protein
MEDLGLGVTGPVAEHGEGERFVPGRGDGDYREQAGEKWNCPHTSA